MISMPVKRRERREMMDTACAVAYLHTYGPDGYVEWHEWAERFSRTHNQLRCPGCRKWLIWNEGRGK